MSHSPPPSGAHLGTPGSRPASRYLRPADVTTQQPGPACSFCLQRQARILNSIHIYSIYKYNKIIQNRKTWEPGWTWDTPNGAARSPYSFFLIFSWYSCMFSPVVMGPANSSVSRRQGAAFSWLQFCRDAQVRWCSAYCQWVNVAIPRSIPLQWKINDFVAPKWALITAAYCGTRTEWCWICWHLRKTPNRFGLWLHSFCKNQKRCHQKMDANMPLLHIDLYSIFFIAYRCLQYF